MGVSSSLSRKRKRGAVVIATVKIDDGPGAEIGRMLPVAAGIKIHEDNAAAHGLAVKILKSPRTAVDNFAPQPFGGGGFRGQGIGKKGLDGYFESVYGKGGRDKGANRCCKGLSADSGL